jgi:hypothetical protein
VVYCLMVTDLDTLAEARAIAASETLLEGQRS